jgi:Uma2 family endonuclease
MASVSKHFYAPEEYLTLERKSPYRSEYCAGEIFAMTGASRQHNIIVANVTALLINQFEDRECEVYPNGMRVRTSDTTLYTYPDVVALCGEPLFEDDSVDTLLNPALIIEVLSPSTEADGWTRKLAGYRKIASLQEYVLIAQRECRVTQYIRQPGGPWLFQEAASLDETMHLSSVKCDLPLQKVYRRVPFPAPDDPI